MMFRYCGQCGFSSIWKELPNDFIQCGQCLRKRKEVSTKNPQPSGTSSSSKKDDDLDDLFANF